MDERYSEKTASSYISGINIISSHYKKENNNIIDIYTINDINFLKILVKEYGIGGKYEKIGENGIGKNGHGVVRNAIVAYVKFLEHKKMDCDAQFDKKNQYKGNKDLLDSNNVILIKENKNLIKKKKLNPNNKHEILNKAFDFMLPILPGFIGNILQKNDKNTWWQKFVGFISPQGLYKKLIIC